MSTIHGVVRLDQVNATYHGPIFNVQNASADMDNGSVVQLGDLVSGAFDCFQVKTPDATSIDAESLLLVASPELNYLAGQVFTDFYNPEGSTARAYQLKAGDIFTVSNIMLTGTPAVDSYVEPTAGATLLTVTATAPTTKFVGKIIETTTIYGQPATAILVVQN